MISSVFLSAENVISKCLGGPNFNIFQGAVPVHPPGLTVPPDPPDALLNCYAALQTAFVDILFFRIFH